MVTRFFLGCLLAVAAAASALAEDPPGRVARLNYIDGTVSFAPAGSDDWAYAQSNRPLTTGDQLWMDKGARAELSIGSAVLRSDAETSVRILALDDNTAQFEVNQGTVELHVRSLEQGERVEVDTPNLAFVADQPGDYRFDIDPQRDSTAVAIRRGGGTTYGDNERYVMYAPRYARFTGTDLARVGEGDLPADDRFERWVDTRNGREGRLASTRYVPRDMVGYEELDDYGGWQSVSDYGAVWFPTVTVVGWAPYHWGHWVWIAPWGWTWVDDAPWGFAPFHYGRWVYYGNRWGWVPGAVVARPYYAPALVAFIGGGSGSVSWGFSLSVGSPGVAWFPLGPRDVYQPAYGGSSSYITRLNRPVVVTQNLTQVTNVYVNRSVPGAVTAVPAAAFVSGQPVNREAVRVDPRQLAQQRVVSTMPALAPARASVLGDAKRAAAPPAEVVARARPVIATAAPATPAATRDNLARSFAERGGRVAGVGPTLAEQPLRSERAPRDRETPGGVAAPARELPSVRLAGSARQGGRPAGESVD